MGLLKWFKHRAKEPSTYTGVGMIVAGAATAAGNPELGASIEPIVSTLLTVLGGILIGKPKTVAIEDAQPPLPFSSPARKR